MEFALFSTFVLVPTIVQGCIIWCIKIWTADFWLNDGTVSSCQTMVFLHCYCSLPENCDIASVRYTIHGACNFFQAEKLHMLTNDRNSCFGVISSIKSYKITHLSYSRLSLSQRASLCFCQSFPCLQVVRRTTSSELWTWYNAFRVSDPIPVRYLFPLNTSMYLRKGGMALCLR